MRDLPLIIRPSNCLFNIFTLFKNADLVPTGHLFIKFQMPNILFVVILQTAKSLTCGQMLSVQSSH